MYCYLVNAANYLNSLEIVYTLNWSWFYFRPSDGELEPSLVVPGTEPEPPLLRPGR